MVFNKEGAHDFLKSCSVRQIPMDPSLKEELFRIADLTNKDSKSLDIEDIIED